MGHTSPLAWECTYKTTNPGRGPRYGAGLMGKRRGAEVAASPE